MRDHARARVLYSGPDEAGYCKYWYAETLWKAAENAAIQNVPLSELGILDDVVWFGGAQDIQPTLRRVADRARDIFQADLSYPIIQIRGGEVIDGAAAYQGDSASFWSATGETLPDSDVNVAWVRGLEAEHTAIVRSQGLQDVRRSLRCVVNP